MQVEDFLETSAGRYAGKTALVVGSRRFTYRELDEQANRLAHALLAAGVNRGDRVMIHLENSAEAVISIFAALKAGAVFVMVNPSTKAEKLAFILANCGAAALITQAGKFDELRERLSAPSLKAVLLDGGLPADLRCGDPLVLSLGELLGQSAFPSTPPPKRCIDMDLAALLYTSGSTGKPKGVMLTHLNMVSVATSIATYLENTAGDVVLNVLPLSFGYGLYQVFVGFKVGATILLERSFAYPAAVLARMAQEGATGIPIIPTISAMLLQMDLRKWDLSRLRYITNAGAGLPVDHVQKLRQLLPHVQIYCMYGLTECQRASYLPPEQIDIRPASVGRGMPNEEVYLVDEQGKRVGPGMVGELVIRGSHVMKGYWQMPEETERMLRPGAVPWEKVLHSGDLFRMDEEGYLYFVSRKDDIIKTRGEKVSPKEVEEALYLLRGVVEAAVIGVPDEMLGTAVKAILVTEQEARLTENDVLRHCAARLEEFMLPKYIEFRQQLPRTLSGKIAKRELAGSEVA